MRYAVAFRNDPMPNMQGVIEADTYEIDEFNNLMMVKSDTPTPVAIFHSSQWLNVTEYQEPQQLQR